MPRPPRGGWICHVFPPWTGPGEEVLLNAAEKLIGVQFVFSGSGAAQEPHVSHDHGRGGQA